MPNLTSLNTAPVAGVKRAVAGPVAVGVRGLEGDAMRVPTQAISAYPHTHYPFWQTVRAQARVAGWDDVLSPGALGENLTLAGLLETDVWIGDVLRFADCELAVSEPRLPDAELDAALGFRQASSLMAANGWCGFYLAVHHAGTLRSGEAFELIAGPREIGISELFRARVASARR